VSNTIASNNSSNGIVVQPTGSAVVTGVLSKVTANNNTLGGIDVDGRFTAAASLNVTIVDSVASNNLSLGVDAVSSSGAAATAVMLRNVVASNDVNGLVAQGNSAILRVAHSVITGNGVGVFTLLGGVINSYGDNDIDGNSNNNIGALTTIPTH
jgi:hypothetical protein